MGKRRESIQRRKAKREKQRREKLRYWKEVMEEQEQSGSSIRGFCRERDLSHSAFCYWRDKVKEIAQDEEARAEIDSHFLPVKIVEDRVIKLESTEPRIEIELQGGRTLKVRGDLDVDFLKGVVSAVEGA